MRWMKPDHWNQRPQHYVGDFRVKKKFLLLPKCLPLTDEDISDMVPKQWRWLEKTGIEQRCVQTWKLPFQRQLCTWKNVAWEEELEDEPEEIDDDDINDDDYMNRVGIPQLGIK